MKINFDTIYNNSYKYCPILTQKDFHYLKQVYKIKRSLYIYIYIYNLNNFLLYLM